MSRARWVKLWHTNLFGDPWYRRLGWQERGLYLQLLALQANLGGSLPDDTSWLASETGTPPEDFMRAWARLQEKFPQIGPGEIANPKMLREATEAEARYASAAEGARKTNALRRAEHGAPASRRAERPAPRPATTGDAGRHAPAPRPASRTARREIGGGTNVPPPRGDGPPEAPAPPQPAQGAVGSGAATPGGEATGDDTGATAPRTAEDCPRCPPGEPPPSEAKREVVKPCDVHEGSWLAVQTWRECPACGATWGRQHRKRETCGLCDFEAARDHTKPTTEDET